MRPGSLLAWAGGAQPSLLRETPADATRYSAMGAVLIGTAGMAALSATFALTTAVQLALAPAIVVGLLWGALIFSLDRMLVISMSRQTGFWRNLGAAVPRLGLALLIGTVISVPLVLRIFEPELNNELQVMHSENLIANQKKLDEQFADIATTQSRVDQQQAVASGTAVPVVSADPDVKAAQATVDSAQKAYDQAAAKAQCELNGGCGTKSEGDGPAYQAAKADADRNLGRLNRASARLQEVTAVATARIGSGAATARTSAAEELKTLVPALEGRKAARTEAQRDLDAGEQGNTGLLARLEALERLSDGHPTMWAAHLALMALFACIELLPVLAKLLSGNKTSLYDQLVAKREGRALAVEQRWQDQQDEIDTLRAGARRTLEADRLDQQVDSGRRANTLLAEKQEGIARQAIEMWGKVAAERTDEELARWYQRYSRSAVTQAFVPQQTHPTTNDHFPVNGQPPGTPHTPPAHVAGP